MKVSLTMALTLKFCQDVGSVGGYSNDESNQD